MLSMPLALYSAGQSVVTENDSICDLSMQVRKWRLCLASNMAPGQPGVDTFIKELVAEVGQGRMAARSPGSGEPNLRALVMVKAARRRPVEEALDVLFAEYGLGQQLVSYVSGKVSCEA